MRLILLYSFFCYILASCMGSDSNAVRNPVRSGDAESQRIIDAAIAAHGGEHLQKHHIEFEFRSRTYKSIRDGGIFQYERIFIDSSGQHFRDVLTNDGFVRYIDGEVADITDERKKAYSSSVNSVIYFALLPYFLTDPAVQSQYIDEVAIQGEPYHKVKVTFTQEGGGKDYQDEFIYWFHQDRHTMDYLTYNYLTDGGGSRFRQAINPREIGGIRFTDYINYKHPKETRNIMDFDRLFEAGGLDSLSLIATENIIVNN